MIHSLKVAKDLASYAKRYSAGAFSTPLAKEIESNPEMIVQWDGVTAVVKTLTRHSRRTDYTGRLYILPKHARVITNLAAASDATLPDFREFDYIYAYAEDQNIRQQLISQSREIVATRVSASSEIIDCWGLPGSRWTYGSYDAKTFTELTNLRPPIQHMQNELQSIDDWHDDFPFYSDGSWSAISLRGYKPDDPQWGVKPSEMPRAWLEQHPEAVNLQLGWTTMAARTPIMRAWVESTPGWSQLERVRLFRMTAKPKLDGKLRRHSDIQDKSAGTRDGQLARFHVPIVTHNAVKMTCWNLLGQRQAAHMQVGHVYYLDVRKPHAVANNSPVDRVHLVIDVVVNAQTRAMIEESREVCDD